MQKWEEHVRAEKGNSAQSISAAQLAWQRWAAVPRKARTVLKQADREGVAILELSYLQFMEDVKPPALLHCIYLTLLVCHNMLFNLCDGLSDGFTHLKSPCPCRQETRNSS